MSVRRSFTLALLVTWAATAAAETVTVAAGADATLVEHPTGAFANGSGSVLFVGRTGQPANSRRRAVLYFDVAAAIPRSAVIERVELVLVLKNERPPAKLRLYTLLADWGEGASASSGGGGAPSQPGDATWIHTSFDDEDWVHAGGDFAHGARASSAVGLPGRCTWGTTRQMEADVARWVHAPDTNFGWILIGNEDETQSALRFDSRESPAVESRPVLTVDYRLPGRRRR